MSALTSASTGSALFDDPQRPLESEGKSSKSNSRDEVTLAGGYVPIIFQVQWFQRRWDIPLQYMS